MRFRTETPECNEIQVCSGKHQLNADQNENSMLPAERGEQADGEKRGRDNEKKLEGWSHRALPSLGSTGRWPVVRGSLSRTSFGMSSVGTSMLAPFAKMHSARRPNAA